LKTEQHEGKKFRNSIGYGPKESKGVEGKVGAVWARGVLRGKFIGKTAKEEKKRMTGNGHGLGEEVFV